MATEQLEQHIRKFVNIEEEKILRAVSFFSQRTLKKKEVLHHEGFTCNSNFFVVKGCLRMFFVSDKGTEQTTQFALESWWLSDYTSFESRKPSGFSIQAVEKSEILAIDHDAFEEMLSQVPELERYFRLVHQRAHAAAQFRMKYMANLSREDMYHHFNDRYPEFVQRIPQYLLASFLGFTPEYLSEIRARKRS